MVRTESLELSCTKRWRLKPVCLPIPPRPQFLFRGREAPPKAHVPARHVRWCGEGASNSHVSWTPGFEAGASTDSAIAARFWWAGGDSNSQRFHVTVLQTAAALTASAACPRHALSHSPVPGVTDRGLRTWRDRRENRTSTISKNFPAFAEPRADGPDR